ncbi:hypothetical protein [Phenylobacterium sp.]|jgi:hypothetical protein|uniref:hypothetical protein n=1 Tax=Phenylobacterium sp. TaxID=1871053 RepID=UPI002F3EAD25
MANPPRPRGGIPTPQSRLDAAPRYVLPEADAETDSSGQAGPDRSPPANVPDPKAGEGQDSGND